MHILFEHHELVCAEGAISESFFPGEAMLRHDAALRAEMLTFFPDLASGAFSALPDSARPVIRGGEAAALRFDPLERAA